MNIHFIRCLQFKKSIVLSFIIGIDYHLKPCYSRSISVNKFNHFRWQTFSFFTLGIANSIDYHEISPAARRCAIKILTLPPQICHAVEHNTLQTVHLLAYYLLSTIWIIESESELIWNQILLHSLLNLHKNCKQAWNHLNRSCVCRYAMSVPHKNI